MNHKNENQNVLYMNRNHLDRKGRLFKKLDKITQFDMLHYDDICKAFNNLIPKGNLTRYYKAGIQ